MSEPVAKHRPSTDFSSTDFEEFERFIQESQPRAPRGQGGDPLAELARLVGHNHDPYGDVFAREPTAQTQAIEPKARRAMPDFAAIEAGLRGSIPAHAPQPAPSSADAYAGGYAPNVYAVEAPADDAYYTDEQAVHQGEWSAAPPARTAPSRRPVYAMAAVILTGVVGIGVAFAYKGSASGPREIAMIKAAPGPTKIHPATDETPDPAIRDASILDKTPQPAPTKTVNREEQPVDLADAVQKAPQGNAAGLMPLYNFGASGGADAASVPVPPPPGASRQMASAVASDIEPIRVKTQSYRPDGTPIPNDTPPAGAMPAPAPAAKVDRAPVAKASTPKVANAKTTTRISGTPKPIVTAAREDDQPATDPIGEAAAPSAKKKTAKAKAKPVQTASATDPAEDAAVAQPVASPSGNFAVQVAAPGTEAEARHLSARLAEKYAGALGGRRLGFHEATSNGRTVYRVRVSSLSREEAVSLCEKLKASGGSCFVARN